MPKQINGQSSRKMTRPSAKPFKFGYLVHDVSRIRRTLMDHAMRPLGITRSQWSVLSTLSRGGEDGMMQVDLARLLDVGKVTVGGLVDRLEATGYVERRADPRDRRARRVCITDEGFAVLRRIIEVAGDLNDRILSRITPENQEITENTLAVVKDTMKEILLDIARAETNGDRKSSSLVKDELHS